MMRYVGFQDPILCLFYEPFLVIKGDSSVKIILALVLFSSVIASSAPGRPSSQSPRIRSRVLAPDELVRQYQISVASIINNLPTASQHRGAVAASPTQQYQFHWTRDGALVWQALLRVYQTTADPALKTNLIKRFQEWVQFEKNVFSRPHRQA